MIAHFHFAYSCIFLHTKTCTYLHIICIILIFMFMHNMCIFLAAYFCIFPAYFVFGTCCFVPMSYFYSETNDWSKDWAKQWARLWYARTSHLFHRNFHFTWKKKKWLVAAWNLQSIKTSLTLELSKYHKSGSMFSSSEPVAAHSDWWHLDRHEMAAPLSMKTKAKVERRESGTQGNQPSPRIQLGEDIASQLVGLHCRRRWAVHKPKRHCLLAITKASKVASRCSLPGLETVTKRDSSETANYVSGQVQDER